MKQKTLKKYGEHGRTVRVFLYTTPNGTRLVRAQWRELGKKCTESKPDTPENRAALRAYAEGIAERLRHKTDAPPADITLADLFTRYVLAHDDAWRASTRTNALGRWKKFATFAGGHRLARTITPEMMDDFRAAMKRPGMAKGGKGHAVNQIAEHVKVVKAVFRFGRQRKLLVENPLSDYVMKVAKDERRMETEEYTPEEWSQVLGQLTPRTATGWRAYCLIVLAGVLGPRQKALRSLRWSDVDLETRVVTWPAWTDKLGKSRTQPMPRDAVRVFRFARVWRQRERYEGEWIFYGAQQRTRGKPYTAQALINALHVAADDAGVPRIEYRAMHGLRRTAAGNVLDLTGDVKAAADWIGDSDLRVMSKYLKKREVRQRDVAARVTAPAHIPKGSS